MLVLKTKRDLYDAVHIVYGRSHEWLTGLAKSLGVSYNTAEHLAMEAGYSRHRLIEGVSLDEFCKKPYAMLTIKKKV